ncbi:helix-turn-helix domain-containing protein [Streptomyces buecherae]|uniref:helix-turn-helix domain-containing protein n=1 Tax=Streptomyces buecherae TaxID=2763006 RepID=UPI0036B715D9
MSAESPHDPQPVAPVTPLRHSAAAEGPNRLLGAALRQLRLERGMTLEEVADAQEISASAAKLSRLERGQSPVKERDLRDLLRHYRASAEQQEHVAGLFRAIREAHGRATISDLTPKWLERLILLEENARSITTFERNVVPGLLQTPAYARVLVRSELEAEKAAHDEVIVNWHVRHRLWRWEAFEQRTEGDLEVIIGEAALCQVVGDRAVMHEQMKRLREVAGGPRVILRVHPFVGGSLRAPRQPVTHLVYDDGGPRELVYFETIDKAVYLTSQAHVEGTRERLLYARGGALTRRQSQKMLDDYVEKYAEPRDGSGEAEA